MNQKRDYRFYVIEFSQPPYKDSDKYVCIPKSWVKETLEEVAFISFPIEELSVTKKRVMREEPSSDDWTIVLAVIKHGTDTYKDASDYIKKLDAIQIQNQNRTMIDEGIPSTSGKRIIEASSDTNSNTEPMSSGIMSNQTELTNPEAKICQEKTVDKTNSNPQGKIHFTRHSLRKSSSVDTDSSLDQTAKNNSNKTGNCDEESGKAKPIKEKQTSVRSKSNESEFTDKSVLLMALRSVLGDNFREILIKLHSEFEKNHIMLEKMRLAFLNNCKLLEELIKLTDEFNDCDIGNLNDVSKDVENDTIEMDMNTTEIDEETGSDERINDQLNESDGNDGKYESEDKKKSIIIRGLARKFTLPPEYKPDDTKWTLKHPKKGKGLVELMPKSGVYVEDRKLSNCLRTSKDSKTLARMLLLEVFSESALRTCSLSGKKACAFDREGNNLRPGLDKHAKSVLLTYVEQHTIEKGWYNYDSAAIANSLRNKLQDLRNK